MDVLLADVVAAEPVVVIPVAHLVFHFGGHFVAAFAGIPHPGAVPIHPQRHDVTDGAVFQMLDGFQIRVLVMPLQSHADFQVLLLGNRDVL
jgi:hypothetical protein